MTGCDLLIVGGGPAGIMAGVQAVRSGLRAVVVERSRPGGSVRHARWMENVPGFPHGVTGSDLADGLVAHAAAFGVPIERDEVVSVEPRGRSLIVRGAARSWEARSVLLATGASPVPLGVPGEAGLLGRRVFHHFDEAPPELAGGDWLVAGGGDVAFDQALALAPAARSVAILVRGGAPRAVARLLGEAAARGLPVRTERQVECLCEEGGRLSVRCVASGGEETFAADGLLVCVGKRPEVALLPPEIVDGAVLVRCDPAGRTPVPGLWVAGDVRRGLVRQVAVAAGDGIAAAMEIARGHRPD